MQHYTCGHPLQGTSTRLNRCCPGNSAGWPRDPTFIIPQICPLHSFSISEPRQWRRADRRMQRSKVRIEPRLLTLSPNIRPGSKCLQSPSCLSLCTCNPCLPPSLLHWLLLNPRLKSDAKNLLLTSSAQIFEKSPHPPQEERAGKKRERQATQN